MSQPRLPEYASTFYDFSLTRYERNLSEGMAVALLQPLPEL